VFGLFSILLIFNFIIINIKNSTRDIGIYMSLGMSGTKISLIYFFQVLIMGLISFVGAMAGTVLFILILDASFSAQTLVNLPILKVTVWGLLLILGIASIVPNLAIILPLWALSRKKPVDVIKTS
jgi:ABC-type antimicrobial peptide transport system permease subunit